MPHIGFSTEFRSRHFKDVRLRRQSSGIGWVAKAHLRAHSCKSYRVRGEAHLRGLQRRFYNAPSDIHLVRGDGAYCELRQSSGGSIRELCAHKPSISLGSIIFVVRPFRTVSTVPNSTEAKCLPFRMFERW